MSRRIQKMPSKPLKPCNKRGCPILTRGRYCDDHKQLNNSYDTNRGTAAQRGYKRIAVAIPVL
ncbi:hypothetical protein V7152_17385 [Neobacillus drentensis]|uniref:hypothetical protein n=1 Tax=Neobacillus drentensis TaxID=220684 RepID=UPI002FFF6E65